ncbi:SusC/RagA family TonB-linked outer membrane protein [Flavobacteriaceae bacterium F08102]|nr:SusC/RagA family TonB-linked outer membrane protein [Flavobacteriaceae bacterium F08102]
MNLKLTNRYWLLNLKRIRFIMRIFILLLTTSIFALTPRKANSQNTIIYVNSDRTVTIEEVFDIIKAQTNYLFIYNEKHFIDSPKVKLKEGKVKVLDMLESGLKPIGCGFEFLNNTVIVKKINDFDESKLEFQDKIKVEGIIRDQEGSPLVGVAVYSTNDKEGGTKNVTNATTTDFEGKYTININLENYIAFRLLGYKKKVVYFNSKSKSQVYDVVLYDENELEEVVVTGYTKVNKTRSTGSVGKIEAQKIAETGAMSIDQALKGQISGTTVMSLSGRPGASAQIRIRGLNSITGDMNPIWIIDGMEMQGDIPNISVGGANLQNSIFTNGIGAISPNDIESITVLKDAAASALYGARAANGVIVVTTKSGKAGENKISVSSSYAISEAPESQLDMMNTQEKISYERGIYEDFGSLDIYGRVFQILKNENEGIYSPEQSQEMIANLSKVNTNWFDEIFRKATSQSHSVSLSGGDEKLIYYGSANYGIESGILRSNQLNTFNSQIKINVKPKKNIQIELQLRNNIRSDNSPNSAVNAIEYATFANTYERPYNDDGSYAYDRSYENTKRRDFDEFQWDFNMLEDLDKNSRKTKTFSTTFDAKIVYDITNNLSLESQFQYTNTNRYVRELSGAGTYSSALRSFLRRSRAYDLGDEYNKGSLRESSANGEDFALKNLLTYNLNLDNSHFISVLLGQELSKSKAGNFYSLLPEYNSDLQLGGYPQEYPNVISLTSLDLSSLGNSGLSERRTSSFFANASYSYKDTHILNGTIRYDGVDIIGNVNNFTPLWNTSYKTNLHKYFKMNYVDVLSIRASYGYTGSIDKNALPFSYLNFGRSDEYNGVLLPSSVVYKSPNIKWQKKLDRNLGLDLSLFDHRVNMNVNVYSNQLKDLLDFKELPYSSGVTTIKANVATLVNRGVELDLNTFIVRNEDWRLSVNLNLSKNRNEITKTHINSLDELPIITRQAPRFRNKYFVKGYDASAWFGYQFAGIDPNTGNALAYVVNEEELNSWEVHSEINGRKVIDMDKNFNHKATVSYLGKQYPDISGGFGTSLTYKGITLTTNFNYLKGNLIKQSRTSPSSFYSSKLNVLTTDANRWRQPGDVTNVGELRMSRSAYDNYFYDNELEDGSFLKLSYVNLGWNMPQNLISSLGLQKCTFNFNTQNIFTWTKYTGLDPENNGDFAYPSPIRYSFSLNLIF